MPETILVYVGLDAVGDGLIKLAFIRGLRRAFPTARITWMAGKGHTVFADTLAPLVTGLIDEVIDEAGIGSHPMEVLRRPLPARSFDLIIDTQRRVLTSLILRRIRHRRFVTGLGRPKPRSMAAQLAALLCAAGGRPDAIAALPRNAEAEAEAERLLPSGPVYVGLAPGAGGKHKCWPLAHFIALGQRLAARGMVPVVLLGPAEAEEWVAAIQAGLPQALLPLQQARALTPMLTIALAARMRAAVANDSGTGHMLAAADIALVSLFGPTPPEKFAPTASRLAVVRAQDFGSEAMAAIPVDAVDQALRNLL